MQEMNDLTPAERELETALGSLRPTAPPAWGDVAYRVGFAAGRKSMATPLRLWRAAAASLAVSAALWFVPREGKPSPPSPVALLPAPSTAPQSAPDPDSAIALREAVLAGGLDALPLRAAGESQFVPSAGSLR